MAQTTTNNIPKWMENFSRRGVTGIANWLRGPNNYVYGSRRGESLYTGMNQMQRQSLGNVNAMANSDIGENYGFNDAGSMWGEYANAGPTSVQTWGVMDDKSPLGEFNNYMNPYIQNVLDPQIREIDKQRQRQANDIGAQTMMSGAFGGARHGIMEGQNYQRANEAVSDATGRAYSDAFDRALGARSSDLGRFLQAAGMNQSAQERAIERKGTAATGIASLGQQRFNMEADLNDMLYNAGTKAWQEEERRRMAMQQFQEAVKNNDYESWVKLLSAINGAPRSTSSTTESDTGWLQLLGAGLGAFI